MGLAIMIQIAIQAVIVTLLYVLKNRKILVGVALVGVINSCMIIIELIINYSVTGALLG